MHYEFEIRAAIPVVGGKRWETINKFPDYAEHSARVRFEELVKDYPFYFELLKVGRSEDCLNFTKDR